MAKRTAVTSNVIAKHVGVSRTTVSVVLNDAKSTVRVSEATRARVLRAAAELGYTPHPAAQALRRQRSGVIGYVPRPMQPEPFDEPVPFFLGAYISRAAARHGFHIVEANAESTAAANSEASRKLLLDHWVDGVIFDSPVTALEVQRFVDDDIPVVQLMRPQFSVETARVTVRASEGMSAAVDHLVRLGHTQIAFLGQHDPHPVIQDRLKHFVSGLARHNMTPRQEYILLGQGHDIAQGHLLAKALFDREDRPTAIVSAADNLTLGTLRYLYKSHLRVPETVSLISYDDTFVSQLYPPITSISQPLEEVAQLAITILTDLIGRKGSGAGMAKHIELPTQLVVRESTKLPKDV